MSETAHQGRGRAASSARRRTPCSCGYETKALAKLGADTKGAGPLRALALEVVLAGGASYAHDVPKAVKAAAAHFKIDLGKCAAKAKEQKAPKKGKGK